MASSSRSRPILISDDDDFQDIVSFDSDTDTDLAYNLQLQEALAASLASQFSIPASTRVRDNLARAIHDAKFAKEVAEIPDDEWEHSGADFAKPFKPEETESFRLYFKGLVIEKDVDGREFTVAGIGIAICDSEDEVVFEVKKHLVVNGMSRIAAQLKALIEGLTVALSLGLQRITFFCDNNPIFQFVNGRWSTKQHKVLDLVNQVKSLRSKFTVCDSRFVPRMEIKFALKLAMEAIECHSQRKTGESGASKVVKETCLICMEDRDVGQIFSVDGCFHRYCFSCMRQHVEMKLLDGIIPKCPHEDCKSELTVDGCERFLTPKHLDTMRYRVTEASIPATDRVYCPYPRCSLLMSKSEALKYAKENLMGDVKRSGLRRCMKCQYRFCVNCKVPWHKGITCADFKKQHPNPSEEDTKLESLASGKLWRQCVKCSHMIELLEGCYHMTCRCNYEFCYNCGAKWKQKATCECPLWHEAYIVHDGEVDEEDFDSDEGDQY